jgi:1,4-dihydroxy-2-naphthoyl-CoA hydrolase
MIWKHEPTIEILNQLSKSTAIEHCGILFTEIGSDYLIASMPVDHRTIQPAGILHGGSSVLLAETLGSVASSLCVEDLGSQIPVGIEINANHVKSVRGGILYGKATPKRIGKTLHVWQIEIVDESGDLVCTSRLTTMVTNRK